MHKFYTLLIAIMTTGQLLAQQLPAFVQYRHYGGIINPAAFETEVFFGRRIANDLSVNQFFAVNGGFRQQWIGDDNLTVGTSVTSAQGFFTPSETISFLGGAYFISDDIGPTAMDGVSLRGALYINNPQRSQGFWGGLGFSYGYTFNSVDLSGLRAQVDGDPLLGANKLTANIPDFSVGGFGGLNFDNDNMLYFGLSMPQVLEYELNLAADRNYNFRRARHFYALTGMFVDLRPSNDYSDGDGTVRFLEISLWTKYVKGIVPQFDINLKYQLSNTIWIGAGASNSQIFHLETGLLFDIDDDKDRSKNTIRFGYGFDFPFNNNYTNFLGTTHEINLAFYISRG